MPSSSGELKNDERDEYQAQPTVEEVSREASGPLTDDDRLRMIGYDVSLGRPLGFWSSAGMNICHLSFIYDFVSYLSLYAHEGPLLFIVGFPFLVLLHLCLIGPFAELTSTFPVAGGMSTWAWQCARHGVGGERYWGYVVGGFTLAMHLGKIVAYIFSCATSVTIIYYSTDPAVPKIEVDAMGYFPIDPKKWWEPVFYLAIIGLVAVLCITRVARNGTFWIAAGTFNVLVILLVYGILIACAVKLKTTPSLKAGIGPMNWGFPRMKDFPYSMSRMIFMGLPLSVMAVDCPVHMAEETRNPSRTVPRVIWTTSLFHYINVYVTVTLSIATVVQWTPGNFSVSPIVPISMILNMGPAGAGALGFITLLAALTQVLAAIVATSRLIFALARDRGMPFSRFLVMTDKHKDPWVAMLALILSLLVSTTCWFVNREHYYGLIQAMSYYFINLPYVIPLILYVLSRLDLRLVGRPEFSIGRLSRPCAWIAILWLILGIIQGSLPGTPFNGNLVFKDGNFSRTILSYLPMIIGGMCLIMLASWFLYGRSHYVGPIRAFTIWATGQDIDPRNVNTATARGQAIKRFMDKKTGRGSSNESDGSGGGQTAAPRATFSGPRSVTIPSTPTRSTRLQRIFGRGQSSSHRGFSSSWGESTHGQPTASVLPESGALPGSAALPDSVHVTRGGLSVLPDSGIFPVSVNDEYGGASVLPESEIFPVSMNDERSVASAAQAESQLLPEMETLAPRTSRRMNLRPSNFKTSPQWYPLRQLSPPPLSPPPATPLTPPPRPGHSVRNSPRWPAMEAAQDESQLEPLPRDSMVSFGGGLEPEEAQTGRKEDGDGRAWS